MASVDEAAPEKVRTLTESRGKIKKDDDVALDVVVDLVVRAFTENTRHLQDIERKVVRSGTNTEPRAVVGSSIFTGAKVGVRISPAPQKGGTYANPIALKQSPVCEIDGSHPLDRLRPDTLRSLMEKGWAVQDGHRVRVDSIRVYSFVTALPCSPGYRNIFGGRLAASDLDVEAYEWLRWLIAERLQDLPFELNAKLSGEHRMLLQIHTQIQVGVYPAKNGFYKRHMDGGYGEKDVGRTFSAVVFMNSEKDYQEDGSDGGELVLYREGSADKALAKISPVGGRLVIYNSREVPHEILPTSCLWNVERKSANNAHRTPAVVICGRSNVGKSTLINELLYGRQFDQVKHRVRLSSHNITHAPVSNKAGRTRHIFRFDLGDRLRLVDLPGYGFAEVEGSVRDEWATLIERYLQVAGEESSQLQRAISLVDARRGVKGLDRALWDMLQEKRIPFQVVLTKVDLVHDVYELHDTMEHMIAILQEYDREVLWPYIHAVSSLHKHGINDLLLSLSAVARDFEMLGQARRVSGGG
ncbi:GTP-binding protein [Perkinsus olseni]|uniref:GTP-binding protein n=1 Tax=Perkinsus olseni TaxID=32597 RepID=A0A7J6NY99_PEROL|nr:GTP-binding protein [Perkinsus olseni]